jgi:hypothetical protein
VCCNLDVFPTQHTFYINAIFHFHLILLGINYGVQDDKDKKSEKIMLEKYFWAYFVKCFKCVSSVRNHLDGEHHFLYTYPFEWENIINKEIFRG